LSLQQRLLQFLLAQKRTLPVWVRQIWPTVSSEIQITATKKADQSEDDQVRSNDVVQQSGYEEDKNSGNQRYQRPEAQ
jgi:hypothetical protein